MPAIQNEYDDYSYIAMRRGTAKAAPRVADSKKRVSTTNKTVKRPVTKTANKPKATNVSTSRMAAAKNVNKESIRAVMRENSKPATRTTTTTKKVTTSKTKNVNKAVTARKKTTHNLDVPNIKKKAATKPQEISLKKADMMKSPKQKANVKTIKKENVVRNTAVFLCMFSVLLLICYRSSVINESFQALGALKSDLEDTQNLNEQIESSIQKETNPAEIETYAKYQLGMQKPKDSQIQRIYVEKEDRISTPIVIEEEKNSFMDSLINDLLNLID